MRFLCVFGILFIGFFIGTQVDAFTYGSAHPSTYWMIGLVTGALAAAIWNGWKL